MGAGSQTLMRGLDLIETLSRHVLNLTELADGLGLTKSTTHRLASALVDRGYLAFTPRNGYRLGRQLLQLGHLAQLQTTLIQTARPHLEALSDITDDAVHLGVLVDDKALYLDKVPGKRRLSIASRVGDRHPLSSTGLGKALMLDHPPSYWNERLTAERGVGIASHDTAVWHQRMIAYRTAGRTFDLDENEDRIRCVAAPIRDASGAIAGAISVSSAAHYMSDMRLVTLSAQVVVAAEAASRDLGHTPPHTEGSGE